MPRFMQGDVQHAWRASSHLPSLPHPGAGKEPGEGQREPRAISVLGYDNFLPTFNLSHPHKALISLLSE